MLTIICGDHTIASRQELNTIKQTHETKHQTVRFVEASQLEHVIQESSYHTSLFGDTQVYMTEHVTKSRNKEVMEMLQTIAQDKHITLYAWEEKTSRDLPAALKKLANVKEIKLPDSVFKLLDACYPGNLPTYIRLLRTLHEIQDASFTYAMLCKHIRALMLAKSNVFDAKIQPWQKKKLATLSSRWPQNKLQAFYEGLIKIDVSLKTGMNIFPYHASLELLGTLYLK